MRQIKRTEISLEKRAKNKRSSLLCPADKEEAKNLLYWVLLIPGI